MGKLFRKNNSEEHDFWMSYTDLLSGFLIVFIVVSMIYYNQNSNRHPEIPNEQIDSIAPILSHYSVRQLEDAANLLNSYNHDKIDFLIRFFDTFYVEDLQNWINILNNHSIEEIDSAFIIMNHYSLKDIDEAMEKVKEKGDMVIVNQEFASVFNNVPKVETIDSIGVIRFYPYNDNEMFPTGSSTMKENLRSRIQQIAKPFVEKAMAISQQYPNLEIRIEGHTDTRSDYMYNLKLSSQRAYSVYECIHDDSNLTPQQKQFVEKQMISVGYSYAKPLDANGVSLPYNSSEVDWDKSRRIEIRIISK